MVSTSLTPVIPNRFISNFEIDSRLQFGQAAGCSQLADDSQWFITWDSKTDMKPNYTWKDLQVSEIIISNDFWIIKGVSCLCNGYLDGMSRLLLDTLDLKLELLFTQSAFALTLPGPESTDCLSSDMYSYLNWWISYSVSFYLKIWLRLLIKS